MLKITGLKLPLGFREGDLKRAAAKQLRLPESAIGQVRLCKKSVDARKKDNVHFVCAVEAAIQGDENRLLSRRRDNAVQKAEPYRYQPPQAGKLPQRPVVVGFGPAGMFAALLLAQAGQEPTGRWSGARPVERAGSAPWSASGRSGALDSRVATSSSGRAAPAPSPTASSPPASGTSRCRRVLEELAAARRAGGDPLPGQAPHRHRPAAAGGAQSAAGDPRAWAARCCFDTQAGPAEIEGGRSGRGAAHQPPGRRPCDCSRRDSGRGPQRPGHLRAAPRVGAAHGAQALLRGRPHRAPPGGHHRPRPVRRLRPGTQPAARRTTSSPAIWTTAGRSTPSACAPAARWSAAASEEGGVVGQRHERLRPRRPQNANAALAGRRRRPRTSAARTRWPGVRLPAANGSRRPSPWAAAITPRPAQRVGDFLAGRRPVRRCGGVRPPTAPAWCPDDICASACPTS